MLPVALLAVTMLNPVDAHTLVASPAGVVSPPNSSILGQDIQPGVLMAQSIVPSGANTIVTPAGSQIDITGGQISEDGENLFHSFQEFGLGEQQTANFMATPQVENILGRVQGGAASYIDGTLKVSNSDANLFLLNPAGILFGPNARLDLNGDFTATTADRMGFADGWWNILGSNDDGPLTGNPTQFSFGAASPGSVVNLGDLAVGANQELTLLGGNVVNGGRMSAPGGRVTLAAVNGAQIVTFGAADGLLTMELTPLAAGQAVSALSLPELLTGGNLDSAGALTVADDGTVALQGLVIPEGTGTAAVTGGLDVSGSVGGEINVVSDRAALLSANIDASGITGGGTVRIGGGYQGNDAIPNADLNYISADSTIDVSATDAGDGGVAVVWADGLTQFYGHVDASGGSQTGDGGFVEISGKNSLIFEGDVDLSAAVGTVGALLLDPRNFKIIVLLKRA
ncbi:MAG: filamentous hemagglutinin N-terminal domain-containing protein [Cyanobacteria bacterium J06642_11]